MRTPQRIVGSCAAGLLALAWTLEARAGAALVSRTELGVPSSIVAPSLLLAEVEVRGARGQPRRPPLVPAPSMKPAQ